MKGKADAQAMTVVEGSVGQESRQRTRALNSRLQNLKDPEGA
jgi:hypothetical protein